MEEIEERGPSSTGSENRHLGWRKLRGHRSVCQRLHGMTPWMEGEGITALPDIIPVRAESRDARALVAPWRERPTPAASRLPPA